MVRFELARAARLLRDQDGVVSRAQLLALGAEPHDIRRLLRRRELATGFDGVYLTHTGPPTRRQREWIALLAAWPAALTGASALPGAATSVVQVAVAHGRKVRVPPGTRVTAVRNLEVRLLRGRVPPRVSDEHAILDLMSERVHAGDVAGAFQALTQVARRTTPDRVLAALGDRERLPGRRVVRDLLHDLRDGACSVLERAYLHDVERAHGLPVAERQRPSRATGRLTVQDVPYPAFGLVIELDGRAYHGVERADADAERDLAELAVSGSTTVRLTYGLVVRSPCRTARRIADLLVSRGWVSTFHACWRCARRG